MEWISDWRLSPAKGLAGLPSFEGPKQVDEIELASSGQVKEGCATNKPNDVHW